MERESGSFVNDFLGGEGLQHAQQQPAGTIAVATDNSRLIVGNIINNYSSDPPADTKLKPLALKAQQWLAPSKQALEIQAMVDLDARTDYFEGTCAWYIDTTDFKEWLNGSRHLEWIHSGGELTRSSRL